MNTQHTMPLKQDETSTNIYNKDGSFTSLLNKTITLKGGVNMATPTMTDNTVNSVDKAAKNYAEGVNEGENTPIKLYRSDLYDRSIRDFKAGAEWQLKQQLSWHTIEGSTGDEFPYEKPKQFKTGSVTVILPDNK